MTAAAQAKPSPTHRTLTAAAPTSQPCWVCISVLQSSNATAVVPGRVRLIPLPSHFTEEHLLHGIPHSWAYILDTRVSRQYHFGPVQSELVFYVLYPALYFKNMSILVFLEKSVRKQGKDLPVRISLQFLYIAVENGMGHSPSDVATLEFLGHLDTRYSKKIWIGNHNTVNVILLLPSKVSFVILSTHLFSVQERKKENMNGGRKKKWMEGERSE